MSVGLSKWIELYAKLQQLEGLNIFLGSDVANAIGNIQKKVDDFLSQKAKELDKNMSQLEGYMIMSETLQQVINIVVLVSFFLGGPAITITASSLLISQGVNKIRTAEIEAKVAKLQQAMIAGAGYSQGNTSYLDDINKKEQSEASVKSDLYSDVNELITDTWESLAQDAYKIKNSVK